MKKFLTDKWLALAVIIIGTFMAILDSSIVNIAIPKMMAVFNASTDQIEWVLTAYMLTMAAVLPLTGLLGERFGLKSVYIFALTVFTLGSFLCGISWNLPSIIIARIIQAIGGGMIMPISMTLIYRIVPRKKIGIAMGFWGIAGMAAPAIGPTLGGYLIEYADWRLIFNVNIPIGILAVACSFVLLDAFKEKKAHKLDYFSSLLICTGLVTLLLALNNGNSEGWRSPYIISLFTISALSLLSFVIYELNNREPLLELRILKNYKFSLSLSLQTITSIALFGGIFLIPIYLQNMRGLTAIQAGLLMFPSSLATAVSMPVSGKIFDKYGAKATTFVGMTVLTITSYLLSQLTMANSLNYIMVILIFRGFGIGLSMMPVTTMGMQDIENHQIGKATALSGTIRQIAGALGIALFSTILNHQQSLHSTRLTEVLNLSNAAGSLISNETMQHALSCGLNVENAKNVIYQLAGSLCSKQSFILSMNDTFLIATYIAAIGVFLSLIIPNKRNITNQRKTAVPNSTKNQEQY